MLEALLKSFGLQANTALRIAEAIRPLFTLTDRSIIGRNAHVGAILLRHHLDCLRLRLPSSRYALAGEIILSGLLNLRLKLLDVIVAHLRMVEIIHRNARRQNIIRATLRATRCARCATSGRLASEFLDLVCIRIDRYKTFGFVTEHIL